MEYFAGANTRRGFVSIFEECFSQVKQLYILKGSSGCGKSTLMKKFAKRGEGLGLEVHRIYCSGDPNSLDGIIIPQLQTAIADGTAPHNMNVKYPCVGESLVNLGEFWDRDKLLPHREEIIDLTDKKGSYYKNAYRLLKASGEAEDICRDIYRPALNRKKLEETAFKLCENVIEPRSGKAEKLFCSAFAYNGLKVLETFGEIETLVKIEGFASQELLKAIKLITIETQTKAILSLSPTDTENIDSVYFPNKKLLFTNLENPPCCKFNKEEKISTTALFDIPFLSYSKTRLNVFENLSKELKKEARKELFEARQCHDKLESIFIPAMNFPLLNEYTEKLIDSVFR